MSFDFAGEMVYGKKHLKKVDVILKNSLAEIV